MKKISIWTIYNSVIVSFLHVKIVLWLQSGLFSFSEDAEYLGVNVISVIHSQRVQKKIYIEKATVAKC